MIRVKLNGRSRALEDSLTIESLIRLLKLKAPHIAVALNCDVVPRSEFSKKKVCDGDAVDILHPVGGG